jgi:hypothetical protein
VVACEARGDTTEGVRGGDEAVMWREEAWWS